MNPGASEALLMRGGRIGLPMGAGFWARGRGLMWGQGLCGWVLGLLRERSQPFLGVGVFGNRC